MYDEMKRWLIGLFFLVGVVAQAQDAPASLERIVLEAPVNSQYTETRPFISYDGTQLYITRREAPANVGGYRDYQDVYRSTRLPNGDWSEPVNLGKEVNSREGDALACTSLDGKTLYLFNTNKRAKFPLWALTEQADGTFGDRQKVVVEDYYNKNDFEDFYISEKFGVMILAIERKDSRGDQDLYVSEKLPDGTYGVPQHMGGTINSGKAEFAPYLSPEGDRLYFISYGFGGLGGADIFYADRVGDSWTSWGRPQNLGDGYNSRGQEIYFSFTQDFTHIFVESWDKAHDDRDIIQLVFPENMRPEIIIPEPEPEPVVIASAQDANPSELTPEVEAAIDEAALAQREQRERNREALASSLATEVEVVDAPQEAPASTFEEEEATPPVKYDLDSTEPQAAEPATLQALSGSQWVREMPRDDAPGTELKYLRNMYFGTGSITLDASYTEHLNRIVGYLKQDPNLVVTIEGHTDVVGSDRVNMQLSENRAQTTAEYLRGKGVSPSRIITRGMGAEYPLASNDDEREGREFNRRVEIALLPQGQE